MTRRTAVLDILAVAGLLLAFVLAWALGVLMGMSVAGRPPTTDCVCDPSGVPGSLDDGMFVPLKVEGI